MKTITTTPQNLVAYIKFLQEFGIQTSYSAESNAIAHRFRADTDYETYLICRRRIAFLLGSPLTEPIDRAEWEKYRDVSGGAA